MQAIFSLFEDDRPRVSDHFRCDLVAIMYGHVVHDFAVYVFYQGLVDLVGRHLLYASFFFILEVGVIEILHIDPGVGVDKVGRADDFLWVGDVPYSV